MNHTVEVRNEYGFPSHVQATAHAIPNTPSNIVNDYRVVDSSGEEEDHYDQLGAV